MKPLIIACTLVSLLYACSESTTTENELDSSNQESVVADTGKSTTMTNQTESNASDTPSVFYWNNVTQKGIEAPVVLKQEEAMKIMQELPNTDGNFFGMMRGENDVVQFMYQDGRGLVLDIPNVAEPVDKVVGFDVAMKIIKDFYAGKSADDIAHAY